MQNQKVLFIGSFLSRRRGTIGISEKISKKFEGSGMKIILSSRKENKWIRFLEIIYCCIVFSGKNIHIDVFSGKSFIIAEVAAFITRVRRKHIILTLHGGKLPVFYGVNAKRVNRLLKKAEKILTPSLYLKQFFQNQGFDIVYLPNSIDLNQFPFEIERPNRKKLLWVRAFSSIYRPELAVETLYYVRKKFPETTLTMVGPDKGELKKVQKIISCLGLDHVIRITGPVQNNELFKYYHEHNVFLNTTAYESFGVAVLEAAACGIPIVSAKVGEIPLLWKNEKEILMVEGADPVLFASAIIRLLSNNELAHDLSLNARQKAEKFNWEVIEKKWIEIFS